MTTSAHNALPGWPAPFRVLVTGSRTWSDGAAVEDALGRLLSRHLDRGLVVVHGAAPDGADRHTADWLARHVAAGAPIAGEEHPADWTRHGRGAGLRRNAVMVAAGADLCLTFIDICRTPRCPRPGRHGSHGAVHTATLAAHADIPVHHVRSAQPAEPAGPVSPGRPARSGASVHRSGS